LAGALAAGLAGVLAEAAFLGADLAACLTGFGADFFTGLAAAFLGAGLAACLTGFGADFFTGLAAAFLGAGLAGALLIGFLASGLPFPPLLAGAAFLVGVLFFLLTI
jgi:hypothetical protein